LSCEVATLSEISINGGSYGIAASAVPYSKNLPTYLRITDIYENGTLNHKGLKSVADPKASKYYLHPNDIVFARTGASTGRNYFYDGTDGSFVYAGFLIKFSIDPDKVNPLYVKYYCQSKDYYDWVSSFNTGSTRGNINAQTFGNMPIPLPPREQQDTLADILFAFDTRIMNNKKISRRLEQIAQAIYKSWFVDFEPWGGVMPGDWKVATVGDFGDIIGGGTPSKNKPEYYTNKGIGWITPKDLSTNRNKFIAHGDVDITEMGLRKSSAQLMPGGTVLFSSRAPIGYIAIANNIVCTNQGFKSVVPKDEIGTAYVYYFLKENLNIIEGMASGSTFREISGTIMKKVPAIIPDIDTLVRFNDFCAPLFERQKNTEQEIDYLAELRDTLLPRLMSGELSIAGIEDA
jgi:type I restriction enzyme S subunit